MNYIDILPNTLSEYSNILLVLATIVYVFFTSKLVNEQRKLREVSTRPFIQAYYYAIGNLNSVEVIVENIGNAPAYNLTVAFNNECFTGIKSLEGTKFAYFGKGQKISLFISDECGLKNGKFITLNYSSKEGNAYIEDINFEMNFHSLTYQPNSSEELKKMNGKFDKLNNKIELMSNNFSDIAKHIK